MSATTPHDYVGDKPAPKPVVRTKPGIAFKALRALASLRFTVILFGLAMALVFFGTLGMMHESIEETMKRYFRSWVVMMDMQAFTDFAIVFFGVDKDAKLSFKVPFPGGYTIGWVMFANLLAAHILRFKLTWKRSGIFMLHAGVIVLLAGEFLTGQLSVETRMSIVEGGSARYAFSLTEYELAAVDVSDPNFDQVVVVPGGKIPRAASEEWVRFDELPFDFRVVEFFPNSAVEDVGPDRPPRADQGFGRRAVLVSKPKVKGTDPGDDNVNKPAAYMELRDRDGKALGTYMFTTQLLRSQPVTVGDKTYQVALRFKRTYKPYEVFLDKAENDYYPGTQIPRDFASTVRVVHPEHGEHGPIRIWMNHPMYYEGETFYQSQMGNERPGMKSTGLQVVKNPAWTFPYFACALVGLGMAFHFLVRLTTFLQRAK